MSGCNTFFHFSVRGAFSPAPIRLFFSERALLEVDFPPTSHHFTAKLHGVLVPDVVRAQVRAFRDQAESAADSSPAVPSLHLKGLQRDERWFVRSLAAAWRLGHSEEDAPQGGKGVVVWAPPLRFNTTHDVGLGMSVAPEHGPEVDKETEEEVHNEGGVVEGGDDEAASDAGRCFDAGEFKCRLSYVVLPDGVLVVDCDVDMAEHWPVVPR